MKSTIIAASLMAALALAKPVSKRYYVTDYETYTVTETVTGGGEAATGGWHGWGSGAWSSPAESATSTSTVTLVPTPLTTPEAVPATTPAPAPTTTWASVAASSAAPASSAAASSGDAGSYGQPILDQHNNHRANHSVPALTWSDDMASCAQEIASSCVYAHNTTACGGGYGQNIGAGAQPSDVPDLITNEMYNGEIGWFPLPYGQAQPDMTNFESWGHFSQIVWKSTTQVGCATQYCPNGLANTGGDVSPYFTVCNYSPPGNFEGEYGANVMQPNGGPTVTVPN